ncbi:uncharacterized protein LOC108697045 [Xenopus laevis]|uniref:Uncharacterized protein LOC108697045 n=1 Tax=Xenopus laevis TaxID=8355 RepID=A0A8J1L907_XENLA|nr:uncharacterized protein LOC108697045 [Xenopus laevis]
MTFLTKSLLLFYIAIYLLTVNIPLVFSCFSCDPSSKEVENSFLSAIEDLYWRKRENFMAVRDFIQEFSSGLQTQYLQRKLDRYGMNMIVSEYKMKLTKLQKKLETELDEEKTPLQIVKDLTPTFKELALAVEDIFASFQERKCPNQKGSNCGILFDKVTNCETCQEEFQMCVGGTNKWCTDLVNSCPMCQCIKGKCFDVRTKEPCTPCKGYSECLQEILPCGTREIQVEEEADLNFDCSVKFHYGIRDEMEYVLEKVF